MARSVKLSAKWQLDAALLSRPVDLTALVTMSRSTPDKLVEDNTLHRLVSVLLNEKNDKKSDKVKYPPVPNLTTLTSFTPRSIP